MLKIGAYNDLKIMREVDFGLYLGYGSGDVLLPTRYVPQDAKVGDTLRVFVYRDSEDRIIATTEEPYAQVGDLVALKVKDVSRSGAFLDWGLPKDLMVPFSEQNRKMQIGEKHVVKVLLDPRTDRILATAKLSPFLKKDPSQLRENQEVELIIIEFTDLGANAVIDESYKGLIYRDELYNDIHIGDKLKGYVKRVREDGKVDLTLRPFGYSAVSGAAGEILQKLETSGGCLPYHDKTGPDTIRRVFKMSKKDFKKAIGQLYREQKVTITPEGIKLTSAK